ncbi:hypothetical protein BU16DRAFT_589573 [Lophium mytilinum]|uniref:F-box domain-containing protein n=1 Tax=Lophium mytilinum TaxID=390894 RepID=A0A6A6QR01_9PEZI|nr:hypothetical protein BU16DRAFT_589573 [Lophium mytilinum]
MDGSLPQKKKHTTFQKPSNNLQPPTASMPYHEANGNGNRKTLTVHHSHPQNKKQTNQASHPKTINNAPSLSPMSYDQANRNRNHNPLHRLHSLSPRRLRTLFRSPSSHTPFPLLALPAELRNAIYTRALTPCITTPSLSIHSPRHPPSSPLFAVSRQIRHEALDVFYRTLYHLQRFHAPYPHRTFATFASHLGADRLKSLRQISVSLPAEGYRFDVDEVLATLPQLRSVEGRIDDMSVTACECKVRIRCRCGAPYYRDWRGVLGESEEFRVLRELVGKGMRVRVVWKTQERDEEGGWLVRDDMFRTTQHKRWLAEVEEWIGCERREVEGVR